MAERTTPDGTTPEGTTSEGAISDDRLSGHRIPDATVPGAVRSGRRRPLPRAERQWLTARLVDAVRPPTPRPPGRWPADALTDAAWRALPVLAEGHGVAALLTPPRADVPACEDGASPDDPDGGRRSTSDRAAVSERGRLDGGWPLGVAPSAGEGDVRAAALLALSDAAARTLARGERLAADRARLAGALREAGVRYAFIKGAWLAPRVYRPPAARPAADIDLWVAPAALGGAEATLARLGYVAVSQSWKHDVWLQPDNRRVVDARGEHPENPRPVELHPWLGEAFRGVRLDLGARWPAEVGPRASVSGRGDGLSLPLGLAHVAAHTTVDMLSRRLRLIALVDIARLAAHMTSDDWRALGALLDDDHAARFGWPALALAVRTLDAPVPQEVLMPLEARCRPALRAWLARADVDALSRFGRPDTPRRLLEIPRLWPRTTAERRALWRAVLWPARAALADRYPRLMGSALWPLGYLRHIGYTLRRLTVRLMRRG